MKKNNIYDLIPADLSHEMFEVLAQTGHVKIERIVSTGQGSPESGWYDQQWNEWVILLQGDASIAFEDESVVRLGQGDHITIPAHTKHRVIDAGSRSETIWLAVHYS